MPATLMTIGEVAITHPEWHVDQAPVLSQSVMNDKRLTSDGTMRNRVIGKGVLSHTFSMLYYPSRRPSATQLVRRSDDDATPPLPVIYRHGKDQAWDASLNALDDLEGTWLRYAHGDVVQGGVLWLLQSVTMAYESVRSVQDTRSKLAGLIPAHVKVSFVLERA